MFCSRSANNKIKKLHKRALRIVCDDYNTDCNYDYNKNIQTLETEMFKIHHGFHKSLLWTCFIIILITFTVYDLNPTFKFQELTPL